MITKEEFLKAVDIVNKYKAQVTKEFNEMSDKLKENKCSSFVLTKDTSIYDAGLSVRAINRLRVNYDTIKGLENLDNQNLTIGCFENKLTKQHLYNFRNTGKKTIDEIIDVFFEAGVIIK